MLAWLVSGAVTGLNDPRVAVQPRRVDAAASDHGQAWTCRLTYPQATLYSRRTAYRRLPLISDVGVYERRYGRLGSSLLWVLLAASLSVTAAPPQVESLTPTGSVKAPPAVRARFSVPMVAFGEP